MYLYQWPVGVRILNRSLPIFIRSSSLCCVARQTCRIIGNEKNNNTIFEKCGTSADFAGPRDSPSECGTVDTYAELVCNRRYFVEGSRDRHSYSSNVVDFFKEKCTGRHTKIETSRPKAVGPTVDTYGRGPHNVGRASRPHDPPLLRTFAMATNSP